MEITKKVEGFIPQIRQTEREQLRLRNEIAIYEDEYKQSDAYKKYTSYSRQLQEFEQKEMELRNEAKNILMQSWIHDFTTIDWITVQLNKTPGSLRIDDNFKCPDEYLRIKKEIDKAKLKKDYIDWKFYDDNISIEITYNLVIKEK